MVSSPNPAKYNVNQIRSPQIYIFPWQLMCTLKYDNIFLQYNVFLKEEKC